MWNAITWWIAYDYITVRWTIPFLSWKKNDTSNEQEDHFSLTEWKAVANIFLSLVICLTRIHFLFIGDLCVLHCPVGHRKKRDGLIFWREKKKNLVLHHSFAFVFSWRRRNEPVKHVMDHPQDQSFALCMSLYSPLLTLGRRQVSSSCLLLPIHSFMPVIEEESVGQTILLSPCLFS